MSAPEPPRPYSSTARRYLSVLFAAAIFAAPSLGLAIAITALWVTAFLGPQMLRAARRRRRNRASPEAGRHRAGIGLGRAPDGRSVVLTDEALAAHALIVGASGAGKSTTMLTILDAEIRRARPVVAIDMKGSPAFARQLASSAAAVGRGLRVWTPEGPECWNPLAHGNATALKDMLIRTERFTEPHYKRAAERYLQTALGVLLTSHPDRPVDLHELVGAMQPRRLAARLRLVPEPFAERLQDYLAGMSPDQLSAIRGLETRLAVLDESIAGPYLRASQGRSVIDLGRALAGGDVVLMSINSAVYGELAQQLGALAIQDVVAAAGRRIGTQSPPAIVAIDEFSALGADNLLALLARGREAGVRGVVATQEMVDLERAGQGFRDQVLGIVGAKIIHRQDVPLSAEMVARMAGTEQFWEHTWNVGGPRGVGGASRGTRRLAERYVVHPNEIKSLAPGEAILLTKLPRAEVRRVAVIPPPLQPAAPAQPAGSAPAAPHTPRVRMPPTRTAAPRTRPSTRRRGTDREARER